MQFGKGTITGVYSPNSVLVDGTPRHIKDVRLALPLKTKRRCCIYRGRIPQHLKATTATVVNVGPETRPRTTT